MKKLQLEHKMQRLQNVTEYKVNKSKKREGHSSDSQGGCRLNVFAKMWNCLIKQSSFFWQKGFSRIRFLVMRLQKWLLEEEIV